MKATIARLVVALLLVTTTVVAAEERGRRVLYVQPLGDELPADDVELVKRSLVEFFAIEVVVLPKVPLPRAAFYPPRRRYRADKLLDFLAGRLPADGERVLGLTGVDISTTKDQYVDWGVLGLANIDGTACVISAFRARKKARSDEHARVRLAKVAVHEIGHTLGLPHCPTKSCLMEDARGLVVTTDGEYDLCPRCRQILKGKGRVLPTPTIPWPRP